MITIDDVKTLTFPELGDDRGGLVVIESGGDRQLFFDIKRVFYVYGTDPDAVRGNHANRNSQFCMINLSGQARVRVIDQMGNSKDFILDRPNLGLFLPQMLWKEMYGFSQDSILLVLSSHHYDKSEYISDMELFLQDRRE